jgi:hypothetical protein
MAAAALATEGHVKRLSTIARHRRLARMGCTAAFAILRPVPSTGLTPVFGPIDSSSPQK